MTQQGRLFLALCLLTAGVAAAERAVIWHDPGNVIRLDFSGGMGDPVRPPSPPFRFLREDLSGTHPKIFVRDAQGALWNVKFGPEAKPESFSWRIARASGYIVESNFFVASGRIAGLHGLTRAASQFTSKGEFREARFQWRNPKWRFLPADSWSWVQNPFTGARELSGLKVILMLTSNWDNKDSRDAKTGPNTGVFEETAGGKRVLLYTFTDWGSTMGNWSEGRGQNDWNCRDFTAQSARFVLGKDGGQVRFGFEGHHRDAFIQGVTPADIAWLLQFLGAISDEQLRAGLAASGASPDEAACFTSALRQRIEALRKVAAQ